jgi:glucose-6-phosphate 1-dehydrogenase
VHAILLNRSLPPSLNPLLLQDFQVFGYARSKLSDAEFRNLIESTLTCRIDAR